MFYLSLQFYFVQNTHLHATVSPQLWNYFQNILNEGGLYEIVNIRVMPATGYYRPVHSTKCISFIRLTTITPILDDDISIPMHKFEIVPLPILSETPFIYDNMDEPIYSTGNIVLIVDFF